MHIHIFWDPQSAGGLQVPVTRTISAVLRIPATVSENHVRVIGFSVGRGQADAQAILDSIHAYKYRHGMTDPVLLVVPQDLYTRGHSFVFGLARAQVGAAVVSSARLSNEYYGREGHDDDLADRLIKEGAHEIGHLLGLEHCASDECIMFKPDTLDELDRKKKIFCPECVGKIEEWIGLVGGVSP
jgi:archaemetzincin